MASLEARCRSLFRSKGFFPDEIIVPDKGASKALFSLLLSTAEKGRASDMDAFRLASLLRAYLDEHAPVFSGVKMGFFGRSSLYSAFSELLSAADSSLASDSFRPVLSKKRLVLSCVSRVKDREARVFLRDSFVSLFSFAASGKFSSAYSSSVQDRLLRFLPVNAAPSGAVKIVVASLFAFLVELALMFFYSGTPVEPFLRSLAVFNLGFVLLGLADIFSYARAKKDMPGIYSRFDILISRGLEPKVLDGLMDDVIGAVNASNDPAGWAQSIISLLNGYKAKDPSKEAVKVVDKWVRVLSGYRKQG